MSKASVSEESLTVEPAKANMKGDTMFSQSFKIFLTVAAYWIVSISMVFINKHLLNSDELRLDAPLFVTWFQCVVTVSICVGLGLLSRAVPTVIQFPYPSLNYETLKNVMPLSVMFVLMIAFNNLCLQYVGVAFYTVGRSLTTVFNVVLTYLILNDRTSVRAIGCCAIIVAGFFLGVNQEGAAGSLSVIGVFFGVAASACVALNSIFTKYVLPKVDGNVWTLSLYNNANASVLFLPVILFKGEFSTVYYFDHLLEWEFWIPMVISGVIAFGIGFVTGLQVKMTSPLTHSISGTAKACTQTVIACWWYQQEKSSLWWLSNFTVLFGSLIYTHVRREEMKKKEENERQSQDRARV